METNNSYNGWSNYETWLVALWIDNEQSMQESVKELIKEKFEYNFQKDEALKELITESMDIDEASLRVDLVNSALSNVNWTEIVASYSQE